MIGACAQPLKVPPSPGYWCDAIRFMKAAVNKSLGRDPTHGDKVLNLLGGAKVGNLDKSGVVNQDVGTLDVAVHDLVVVQVLKPKQDLACIHPYHTLLERP